MTGRSAQPNAAMKRSAAIPIALHANLRSGLSGVHALATTGCASRAARLADSACQRARLMLPIGRESGVECSVTSIEKVSAWAGGRTDFGSSRSLATTWNGDSPSFHSTAAFSTQNDGSSVFPACVIVAGSRSWSAKANSLICESSLTWRTISSCSTFGPA